MTNRPGMRRVAAAGIVSSVVAGIVILSVPRTQAAEAGDFAVTDAHVSATMSAWGVPGLAYAVVQDGRVVHVAAFGRAGPGDRAMTTRTPVVIGSVGKSITALAIRQLVEAGRIDMDASVTHYLPWFALAGPDGAAEKVTARSLLDHTSGLSTAVGQDPRWYGPGLTAEAVVRGLAAIRADRPAGTYAYSNLNYVVLGLVVEAVSGQAYGDYIRTHIFEPLGMTRSSTQLEAAAGPAQGHRYLFGVPVPFDEPFPTGMVAAGYQVSSTEDMARYAAALANGGVLEGVDVVAPGNAPTAGRGYGTDWQPLTAAQADAILSQSGSTLSSNADLMVVPSRRLGVVVLLNANPTQFLDLPAGAGDLALDIIRGSFGVGPGSSAPGVRSVYLVVDAVLVALVAAFIVHAVRARTWRHRLAAARHRRRFVGRTVVADLVLPLVVLIGVPLWIGAAGSVPQGEIVAGWGFTLWTLPDISLTLLVLAFGALAIGVAKLVAVRATGLRRDGRGETQTRGA